MTKTNSTLLACLILTCLGTGLALAQPAPAPDAGATPTAEQQEMVKKYPPRSPGSPEIARVSLVAPDILALTIEAQKVIPTKIEPYDPVPDEQKKTEYWPDGRVRIVTVNRSGGNSGWLQGPKLDQFSRYEGMEGDPLLWFLAGDAASYQVTSKDDPRYGTPQRPANVWRKSLPTDWQVVFNHYPMRHTLYLKMAEPLTPGKTYRIEVAKLNVKNPEVEFVNDSGKVRTDAIHLNQNGWRPDDPGKKAYLSTWLGTGGALVYRDDLTFRVLNDESGKEALTGPVKLRLAPDQVEQMWDKDFKNNTKTAVFEMDLDGLTGPGRYRVEVPGIGCSYPFEIGPDTWKRAFLVQMRGLFHNRGGIELGPPWTTFRKPRDFHPDDGVLITRSSYDPLTKGNEAFEEIVKGDTGEKVTNAWGGYHDAGDWNPRRVSHLPVTMAQLEVMELFPAYFSALNLRIPPTEGVPDILTEAMFEIDCFRRMQQPDGGLPYGIETQGDPLAGEVSWLSNQHAYVLAPNIRDTWHYAAAAARLAKLLQPIKAELAATYLESAKKAFDWAENDYARRKADGSLAGLQELWRATSHRNFAALILYDITGESRYHEIFREDTCLKDAYAGLYWWGKYMQADAAFYYARLGKDKADPELKKNAIAATARAADSALAYASGNAFNLTTPDKYRPLFGGFFSTSGGTDLARAHYLTNDAKYLAGAVRSCQFSLGANPNNIVYTTGLGSNPIRHPLHMDSRYSGQPAPEGLTVFGNVDYWHQKGGFFDWPIPFIAKPEYCHPNPYDWPLSEAYFDIFLFVSMNEFVIDTWAPNVLVWGYLAARRQ